MKSKPIFCINCTSIVNKSTKPSRNTWRNVSDKKYQWLHELLKVRGVQLQSEIIICNKCRIMMYKENKRRRRDKPHTTLDNVNDNNETRSEPETAYYLSSFSDFLISDDIMGSGNDFDYCAMCMKRGSEMRPLSISERMTLLCDHRLYVSHRTTMYYYLL